MCKLCTVNTLSQLCIREDDVLCCVKHGSEGKISLEKPIREANTARDSNRGLLEEKLSENTAETVCSMCRHSLLRLAKLNTKYIQLKAGNLCSIATKSIVGSVWAYTMPQLTISHSIYYYIVAG